MENIKMEILRSLSRKPTTPNQLAFDIWLRLKESYNPNSFKAGDDIKVKQTLKRLFKDGSVVKLRRGIYALSDDARHELFRDSMMALCMNEPEDTASTTDHG